MREIQRIFFAIITILAPLFAAAQSDSEQIQVADLQQFDAIEIEATMEVKLVEVSKSENLRITYDLSDNNPDKFKFEVKNMTLYVSQPRNEKSASPITATIYYSGVKRLHAARAEVTFAQRFNTSIADIKLENGALLTGEVGCDDIEISAFTDSRLRLTGGVKYLTLKISSSAKAELRDFNVQSADINASNGAVVAIKAGERLDISASTSSVVKYWGEPKIIRMRSSLIAGEVIKYDIDE